ncbi:MAG: DUF1799 domain-containing protein [Dehalococcoidia bacterium]
MAPEPDTEVWPENWTVMEVAIRMMSQLNVGMNGVIGMRYEALPVVLDCMAVPASDRLDVLDGLRIVEHEIVRKVNDRGRRDA